VVFDEHVFPFGTLHPNAGARLCAETSLLPKSLLNSSTNFGDADLSNPNVRNPSPVNDITCPGRILLVTAENPKENGSDWRDLVYHRMCSLAGGSTDPGDAPLAEDSGAGAAAAPTASALGPARGASSSTS
jgi:hypothetical protein